MTIRPDIISASDAARAVIQDMGLRVRSVEIVTHTKVDRPDALFPEASSSSLIPVPTPRVRDAASLRGGLAGRVEEGDLYLDRISVTYTRSQLDPGGDSHWLIDGQPYRLVSLEERSTQWVVRLRRMQRNS